MGKLDILTQQEAWLLGCRLNEMLEKAGKKANFCITNSFGHTLLIVGMDNTRPTTLRFAILKADEAAKSGQSTRWIRDNLAAGAVTLGLFGINPESHVPWAGGCPVYSQDGIQLGALGVSGLAEDEDEEFCMDAIVHMGFLSNRP